MPRTTKTKQTATAKKTTKTAKRTTAKKTATAKKAKPQTRAASKNAPAKKTRKKAAPPSKEVKIERRASANSDRRKQSERRQKTEPVAVERRKIERRAKVNRRRQIDPTTCERDYTEAELEFMTALDTYKRTSGRMFPTCSEILEVLKKLGYEKRSPIESPAEENEQPAIAVQDELTSQAGGPLGAVSLPETQAAPVLEQTAV